MPSHRLRLHQLWAHNIPHAVKHEDTPGHEALLRVAAHIRHPHGHNQARDRREEPDDRVPRDRRRCMVVPLALPDHRAAGNHGKAAGHQHGEPDIRDEQRQVAGA